MELTGDWLNNEVDERNCRILARLQINGTSIGPVTDDSWQQADLLLHNFTPETEGKPSPGGASPTAPTTSSAAAT